MMLTLDPDIRPEFLTYMDKIQTNYGETEVWVCKTSDSFGLEQGDDVIILNKNSLLEFQKLVNQAVEILEGK